MDEKEQVVHRRRRRSRAEAAQLLAEYEASGLTGQEFCGSLGLSLATLTRYQKWRREAGGETLPVNRWVSVELADAGPGPAGWTGSGLAITLPAGRRIEVGRGFDAHTLAELLGVLDRF
ncbi:MAG: hypothetical protein Q8M35_02730 [Pseudohongiella sp.]|nr:hypothetical protein [Pseudohongiella sp.]